MAVRAERLKRRADFLRVAGVRRKWVTPGVIVQAARAPADQVAAAAMAVRIGFTTSRKVGNAVARNRARRRLRAAADQVVGELRPGTDLVLIGRTETLVRPWPALVADLRTAIGRLGVLAAAEARPEAPR